MFLRQGGLLAAVLVVGVVGLPTQAWGVAGVQLLVGKRWIDDAGSSGIEGQLCGFLDPIPLVPVGFGLYLSRASFEDGSSEISSESGSTSVSADVTSVEAGPEVQAWLPLPGLGLTPYLKVAYALYGTFQGEAGSATYSGEQSGLHVRPGVQWSPIPLFSVLLQLDISSTTYETSEVKVGGVPATVSDGADTTSGSKAFLVGVQAKL